jgi:hypothetical protein
MAGKALETVKNAFSKLGIKAPWKVMFASFACGRHSLGTDYYEMYPLSHDRSFQNRMFRLRKYFVEIFHLG